MTDESAALATTETEEQPQEQSALRQAASQVTQTQDQASIPEKFQVKRDDGSLDYEASSLKMAQSYSYLEKKLGTGDAPPKSPDEYQVEFSPDVPIKFEELKDDEGIRGFMDGAHKLGMTNAQVSYVLDQYMQALPQDLQAMEELDARECVDALVSEMGQQQANKVLSDAYRAVAMVAGDDADYIMDKYGNDPVVLKYLAKFGSGLAEDSPPQAMQMIEPQQFNEITHELRQQLIDMPKNDPRREGVLAKLEGLYKRQVGDSPAYGLG